MIDNDGDDNDFRQRGGGSKPPTFRSIDASLTSDPSLSTQVSTECEHTLYRRICEGLFLGGRGVYSTTYRSIVDARIQSDKQFEYIRNCKIG